MCRWYDSSDFLPYLTSACSYSARNRCKSSHSIRTARGIARVATGPPQHGPLRCAGALSRRLAAADRPPPAGRGSPASQQCQRLHRGDCTVHQKIRSTGFRSRPRSSRRPRNCTISQVAPTALPPPRARGCATSTASRLTKRTTPSHGRGTGCSESRRATTATAAAPRRCQRRRQSSCRKSISGTM